MTPTARESIPDISDELDGEPHVETSPAGAVVRAHPLIWAALGLAISGVILAVDLLTGPFLQFPMLFLVPVTLTARFTGRLPAMLLGVALPLAHLGTLLLLRVPWPTIDLFISAAVRVVVLVGFAFLVDQMAQRAALRKENEALRGLLPICSFCKNIRGDSGAWTQIEVYIEARSDADFTHTVCPTCAEKHYGYRAGRS